MVYLTQNYPFKYKTFEELKDSYINSISTFNTFEDVRAWMEVNVCECQDRYYWGKKEIEILNIITKELKKQLK